MAKLLKAVSNEISEGSRPRVRTHLQNQEQQKITAAFSHFFQFNGSLGLLVGIGSLRTAPRLSIKRALPPACCPWFFCSTSYSLCDAIASPFATSVSTDMTVMNVQYPTRSVVGFQFYDFSGDPQAFGCSPHIHVGETFVGPRRHERRTTPIHSVSVGGQDSRTPCPFKSCNTAHGGNLLSNHTGKASPQ